jgi:hypothetical protein
MQVVVEKQRAKRSSQCAAGYALNSRVFQCVASNNGILQLSQLLNLENSKPVKDE